VSERADPDPRISGLEACLVELGNIEAILDSVADGILTVDEQLRITHFNRAAETITGYPGPEAVGQPCLEVFRQILAGERCAVCAAWEEKEYLRRVERVILRKDGTHRSVRVTVTPLTAGGQRTGIVVTLHDLQPLRDLKEQVRQRYGLHNLVGKSHRMQAVYRLIEQVADSNASVLIEGESGTGKELVAHAIHYRSRRADKPFVAVSCAALPETLLESELFGHVKGAFTGATANKVGRFEAANGGTIFLDEIGDISPLIQLKLLRVLQEHEFERVGESTPRRVDVRVIAATNKDLAQLVREGRFRNDLYYRLKVVPIHLPPLRDRRDDIPLLVDHFVKRFRRETGKAIEGPSEEAMAALLAYSWPGNVRELENAIEHAFVCCPGGRFTSEHLPTEVRAAPGTSAGASVPPDSLEAAEREALIRALQKAGGNQAAVAQALGLARNTLWRKLKNYGIDPKAYR